MDILCKLTHSWKTKLRCDKYSIAYRNKYWLLILVCFAMLAACAKKGDDPKDPYEARNRKVFAFNQKMDKRLLKPTAKLYKSIVPERVRKGVNNFYNHFLLIPTFANDLLQGRVGVAMHTTTRFLINSTLGVAGTLDVAKHMGIKPHYNDFGSTFYKWGAQESPYRVTPFLGPTTRRDSLGGMLDTALSSPYWFVGSIPLAASFTSLRIINTRTQLLEAEALIKQAALDPYTFQRNAYLQHRLYKIKKNLGITSKEADEANGEAADGTSDADDDDPYVEEEEEKSEATGTNENPSQCKERLAKPSADTDEVTNQSNQDSNDTLTAD